VIGVLSDSQGDLAAFDLAFELLCLKGAKRFFFAGGRYSDLDEWISLRKAKARGDSEYGDREFLTDITNFLSAKSQLPRTPASQSDPGASESDRLKERFVRAPEKGSWQYLDANIGKAAMDMIGDTLCCIVHVKNDLTREDVQNALIFVHGGEAEPNVVQIGPRFFVTPGRLSGDATQTCGLFERGEKNILFSAFSLDGRTIIDRQLLAVDRRAKLSAK
jgi:hypothetical protein